MGFVRHLRAKFYVSSSRDFAATFSLLLELLSDRMSTMLSNFSEDHDEGMDVQEANTFRFTEEPSLEKM